MSLSFQGPNFVCRGVRPWLVPASPVCLRRGDRNPLGAGWTHEGEHAHPPFLSCWLQKKTESRKAKAGRAGEKTRRGGQDGAEGKRAADRASGGQKDSKRVPVSLPSDDVPIPAQVATCPPPSRDRPQGSSEPGHPLSPSLNTPVILHMKGRPGGMDNPLYVSFCSCVPSSAIAAPGSGTWLQLLD